MNMHSKSGIKSSSMEAVVIRANGERVDLGVIAYYHQNPILRAIWHLKMFIKKLIK